MSLYLCKLSGPLRRLLGHIRQSHDSECLLREFVNRLNLLRCSQCQLWFLKLGQHTSQCRKRPPKSTSSDSGCQNEGVATSHSTCQVSTVSCFEAQSPSIIDETSKLLSGGSLREVSYLDPESAAWKFIRKLSLDTILSATPPRAVQSIKLALRSRCSIACCFVALRNICENQYNETAWKLFISFLEWFWRQIQEGTDRA